MNKSTLSSTKSHPAALAMAAFSTAVQMPNCMGRIIGKRPRRRKPLFPACSKGGKSAKLTASYTKRKHFMPKQYSAPPAMSIDANKTYTATFDTSKGKIVCELFTKDAPKTVNNFVFLARDKFYDGLKFHRV